MEDPNLLPLKKMFPSLIEKIFWFRTPNFFSDKNSFYLFNDFDIASQTLRSKGYSYIMDSLSCLATQPGLVIRLFNFTEINEKGVYSVWLNINGVWRNFLVDDKVPVFQNKQGKCHFFFGNPNPGNNEIWYILLEKALARAYRGYQNLYGGKQNHLLKDLTGFVTEETEIIFFEKNQKLTENDTIHIERMWLKLCKSLKKGHLVYLVPRKPDNIEIENSKKLKIFNQKSHINEGIYFSHNYSVISTKHL